MADAVHATEQFWADWLARVDDTATRDGAVRRILITLDALTYAPTGRSYAPVFDPGQERRVCNQHQVLSILTRGTLASLTPVPLEKSSLHVKPRSGIR